MRSRRNRKYRKIEVVDNRVNLVNIKTDITNRRIDKLIAFYDRDMNAAAKLILMSVCFGAIGATGVILIGMYLSYRGVM